MSNFLYIWPWSDHLECHFLVNHWDSITLKVTCHKIIFGNSWFSCCHISYRHHTSALECMVLHLVYWMSFVYFCNDKAEHHWSLYKNYFAAPSLCMIWFSITAFSINWHVSYDNQICDSLLVQIEQLKNRGQLSLVAWSFDQYQGYLLIREHAMNVKWHSYPYFSDFFSFQFPFHFLAQTARCYFETEFTNRAHIF